MKSEKRYHVTTPSGRKWTRTLTPQEVEQFQHAGFKVEEIETTQVEPNRSEIRRQGLHQGSYRMPKRAASLKPKRADD